MCKMDISTYAVRLAGAQCLKPGFACIGHLDASGNKSSVLP